MLVSYSTGSAAASAAAFVRHVPRATEELPGQKLPDRRLNHDIEHWEPGLSCFTVVLQQSGMMLGVSWWWWCQDDHPPSLENQVSSCGHSVMEEWTSLWLSECTSVCLSPNLFYTFLTFMVTANRSVNFSIKASWKIPTLARSLWLNPSLLPTLIIFPTQFSLLLFYLSFQMEAEPPPPPNPLAAIRHCFTPQTLLRKTLVHHFKIWVQFKF